MNYHAAYLAALGASVNLEGIGVPIQRADGHVKILHTFARIVCDSATQNYLDSYLQGIPTNVK